MSVYVLGSEFYPRSADNPFAYVGVVNGPDKHYKSVEALPRWIQERYAVLRLLEEGEPSALGKWSVGGRGRPNETLFLYIVRQPYDPEWEK